MATKAEENSVILTAILDMKNEVNAKFIDLEKHLMQAVEQLKEVTYKDIEYIKEENNTLKKQSNEHYREAKELRVEIRNAIEEHRFEDVNRWGDQREKIEKLTDGIQDLEQRQAKDEGANKGKDSSFGKGATIVGIIFGVIGAISTLFAFFGGGSRP